MQLAAAASKERLACCSLAPLLVHSQAINDMHAPTLPRQGYCALYAYGALLAGGHVKLFWTALGASCCSCTAAGGTIIVPPGCSKECQRAHWKAHKPGCLFHRQMVETQKGQREGLTWCQGAGAGAGAGVGAGAGAVATAVLC